MVKIVGEKNEKIDKELGVIQDPLQQDVIEHPWVGDVKPGSISMGVGWPI